MAYKALDKIFNNKKKTKNNIYSFKGSNFFCIVVALLCPFPLREYYSVAATTVWELYLCNLILVWYLSNNNPSYHPQDIVAAYFHWKVINI